MPQLAFLGVFCETETHGAHLSAGPGGPEEGSEFLLVRHRS